MAVNLRSLFDSARIASEMKGHKLNRGWTDDTGSGIWYTECQRCGMRVLVTEQGDVYGPCTKAVCGKEK